MAILSIAACNTENSPTVSEATNSGVQLTTEALFEKWEYNAEFPGTARWLRQRFAPITCWCAKLAFDQPEYQTHTASFEVIRGTFGYTKTLRRGSADFYQGR